MIAVIKSSELKTNVDLVCTYCGKDHGERRTNGELTGEEGKDFVFETDGEEEWCICIECQKECNSKGFF